MIQGKLQAGYIDSIGTNEVCPGLVESEVPQVALAERRSGNRAPVIKSAQITFGDGISQCIFDCLVLDQSTTGVLVDLGKLVILRSEVTIRLSDGASYLARRRWAVGSRIGLEFIGSQIVSSEIALGMMKIADVLKAQGVVAAVGMLRGERFFDRAGLRKAAEEAEAAHYRMQAILSGR